MSTSAKLSNKTTVVSSLEGTKEPSCVLITKRLRNNGSNDLCHRAVMPRTVGILSATSQNETMNSNDSSTGNNTANTDFSIDQKLVARVQKGDKKAFDLLVVKYQGRVASIVSRYVSDYHEVSDVTQEAFIKAFRAIDRFRGDSAFYTWVYRIAINCAKNYLQAKGRRPPSSDVDASEAEYLSTSGRLKDNASPENILTKNQLESTIKLAIKRLPEELRIALTLREFDNFSYEDIAEVMECPVGTVRSRIFRAREAVEKEINAMRGV